MFSLGNATGEQAHMLSRELEFREYMKQHRTNGIDRSHVVMGEGEFKGTYNFPNTDEFMRMYYQVFIIDKSIKDIALVASQPQDGCIVIDIDLRYATRPSRSYLDYDIFSFCDIVIECLAVDLVISVPIDFHVTYRSNPVHDTETGMWKDGVHIICAVRVPREIQHRLREHFLRKSANFVFTEKTLNALTDIYDNNIATGRNGLVMFGSRKKPTDELYEAQYFYRLLPCAIRGSKLQDSTKHKHNDISLGLVTTLCMRGKHMDLSFTKSYSKSCMNASAGSSSSSSSTLISLK